MKKNPVDELAKSLVESVSHLPEVFSGEDVYNIFKSTKAKPQTLCDAFWTLDNKPGLWSNRDQWHPKLRATRNHPHWGPELFKLFQVNK